MKLKFILHTHIDNITLKKIIDLKKKHWNYEVNEHKIWIENNINNDDIHVIMIENNKFVGYLNLVKTEAELNGLMLNFLGVGNVCVFEKGRGYGKALMLEVQNYLNENKLHGILFCKKSLIKFYEKCGWQLVKRNQILTENNNVNLMIFNINFYIRKLIYSGKLF